MNESVFSLLSSSAPKEKNGIYVELSELVRLQYKARGFSFLPKQPIHSVLSGRHSSRLRGRGLNFEDIRKYLPGDDIRNMDWKVTARMRKPHVRVYTEERDRPVLFIVDQRISMFFGSRRCMKSVVAAETAAIGAWKILKSGDRVGALIFNDSEIVEFTPHRSRQRVIEILGQITRLNKKLNVAEEIKPNPVKFNEVLKRATQIAKHDFLVCIIGDGAGLDEESVRHVTSLSEHNDVLTVFVYDPLEADLPDSGHIIMAEGERQLEINTNDVRLRDRFKIDFQQRLENFKTISQKRDIPLLTLSTAEEAGLQIRKQLGRIVEGRDK